MLAHWPVTAIQQQGYGAGAFRTVAGPAELVYPPVVSDTGFGMARNSESAFPWRLAILGPLTALLFVLALYFYDNLQPRLGLGLLGAAFAVPMTWIVLAARDAEYSDSPMRSFIPRLTVWLVLGSVILGTMHWNTDRLITAMEMGFAVLYLLASAIAMHLLNSRPKRPQLTALSGGNLERPQRRRSK